MNISNISHILKEMLTLSLFGDGPRDVLTMAYLLLRQHLQNQGILHPNGKEYGISMFGKRIFLRDNHCDIAVFSEVFYMTDYALPLNTKPKRILDMGANVGLVSLFYATRYPDAQIYAVEPARENFTQLQKNTKDFPNIMPIKAAFWKKEGHLRLNLLTAATHSIFKESQWSEAVRAITLDSFIEQHGAPDVVKFDIEGAEWEVFSNSKRRDECGLLIGEVNENLAAFRGLFKKAQLLVFSPYKRANQQ